MVNHLIRQYIDLLESSNNKDTSLSFFKLLEAKAPAQKSLLSIIKEILDKHNIRVGSVYYDALKDKTRARVKIYISNGITASIIQEIVTTLTDNGFTIYKCIDDVDDRGSPVLKIYYLKIEKVEKEKTDDERKYLEIRGKINYFMHEVDVSSTDFTKRKSIFLFKNVINDCEHFEYHLHDNPEFFRVNILEPSLLSQGYTLDKIRDITQEFKERCDEIFKSTVGDMSDKFKSRHALIIEFIRKYNIDVPEEIDNCLEKTIQEYQPMFRECLELYKQIPDQFKSKLKSDRSCKEIMKIVFKYLRNT